MHNAILNLMFVQFPSDTIYAAAGCLGWAIGYVVALGIDVLCPVALGTLSNHVHGLLLPLFQLFHPNFTFALVFGREFPTIIGDQVEEFFAFCSWEVFCAAVPAPFECDTHAGCAI